MKLAGIYARVSTARQEEEQTIKTQLSAVDDLVRKNDFKVVERYIDEGWSGDILARPALDRMREDAKSKLWQVLVIYDPDRLARRYSYQELVMDELREAGIEVIFVTVSTPKNSEDKILHGVRGLFAEYERAKIGERFRLGKLRKIKEGHLLVSEPLYGYEYVPKQGQTPGYYVVNKAESEFVAMMFNWVDQDGLTLRSIVRKLQDLGIRPRKSKRGVWATSTLSKMLKNTAYIGQARWGSSYAVIPEKPTSTQKYRKIKKSSRRMRPEAEWLTVPVPAIVDKDVFDRVQEKIRSNFLLSRRNTKNKYLLAGRIYCPCGRKRGGEGPQNGKFLYYRCLDRVLSFPLAAMCREKAVNARITDHAVWQGVAGLMSSPESMRSQVHLWLQDQEKENRSNNVDVAFLRREIAKLKDQEERYNIAYGAGLFTVEQLKEYTPPLREKIMSFEAQIVLHEKAQSRTNVDLLPSNEEIEAFAKESQEALKDLNFESKRGILANIVDKVVATKEKLQISGFIPLSYINVCTSDRYGCNILRHLNETAACGCIPFQLEIDLLDIQQQPHG